MPEPEVATKGEWCSLDFHARTGGDEGARPRRILLSSSLFYFPQYTKRFAGNHVVDQSRRRQETFLEVIAYYERVFHDHAWFRDNVTLRLYYDDSLMMYNAAKHGHPARKPWPDVIRRHRADPRSNFQWVRFECGDERFREAFAASPTNQHAFRGHRGLLGSIMRFHALYDVPENEGFETVCLIDMDAVYTFDWWVEHVKFTAAAKESSAPKVMAIVGMFEIPLFGYIESPHENPAHDHALLHAGITSISNARLPREEWRTMPARIDRLRPYCRYLDSLRCMLYDDESGKAERLYDDFAYGFDEALLNRVVFAPHIVALKLKEVSVVRDVQKTMRFFTTKLLSFLAWNGARSVSMRRLAAASGYGGDDAGVVELLAHVTSLAAGTFVTWDAFIDGVIKPLAPHLPILRELQIDHRVLRVFDDLLADGAASRLDASPSASSFIVDGSHGSDARALGGVTGGGRGGRAARGGVVHVGQRISSD
jgi:hypothetical protein